MDSQDSLSFGEDFSLLAAQGMRQSMDNHTIACPPAPVAASTVQRNPQKLRESGNDDARGSFLNDMSPLRAPCGSMTAHQKLLFDGNSHAGDAAGKPSFNLIEFSKTQNVTNRSDESDEGVGNLSARSSLGILPIDALDFSESLLPCNISRQKQQQPPLSHRVPAPKSCPPVSFKETGDSAEWRDQSKQDSKDQPMGLSHVVDTVKKRPTEIIPTRKGAANMCLFNSGGLADTAEVNEMEQSIVDVQFEEEELKMLDDDFSDIEASDLSDDGNEDKKERLFRQTGLSDFLELERKVNEGSLGLEDEEHGQGEGQESDEDDPVTARRDGGGTGIDLKFFTRTSTHDTEDVDHREKSSGRENTDPEAGHSRLSQLRWKFCNGDGSEIDTEDELEAARQDEDSDEPSASSPRPGLEGQQDEKVQFSMMLRQSAEGDVVTSPVPGDGGGGGDGSSGSESDGQYGPQQKKRSVPHRFAHNQSYQHQDINQETFPEEPRVRPMGDDLLSRDDFAPTNSDNNSLAGIDRFCNMVDVQNYVSGNVLGEVEDWRLQSRFLAPVEQSLRYSDTLAEQRQSEHGPFSSDQRDAFVPPSVSNLSQDSGFNAQSAQGQGPRLDASGFNVDDHLETKEPFGVFESSFGSFGLTKEPTLTETGTNLDGQETQESVASSGLGQSFETQRETRSSVSGSATPQNSQSVSNTSRTPQAGAPVMTSAATKHGVGESAAVYYTHTTGDGPTQLAYHTSLSKEAVEQMPFLVTDDVKKDLVKIGQESDDFFDFDEGKTMLDEDEEKFEKENVFIQDAMAASQYRDVMHASVCSWDVGCNDGNMRGSVGQFWATRTEALGTLEGDPRHPRPEFGMLVKTPPGNRKPVPLIDVSMNFTQPSELRTAGVGDEDEKECTLVSEKEDTALVLDDLYCMSPSTAHKESEQELSQLKKLNNVTQVIQSGDDEISGCHDCPNRQISRDSNSSGSDGSCMLTDSAIESFISKVSSKATPGELVSTIIKISNKTRKKEKQVEPAERTTDQEKLSKRAQLTKMPPAKESQATLSKPGVQEAKQSDQSHREMKHGSTKTASNKNRCSVETSFRGHKPQKTSSKESLNPKAAHISQSGITQSTNETEPASAASITSPKRSLKKTRLPIRKGSFASTYEKAWRERQKNETDVKQCKDRDKISRRRSDTCSMTSMESPVILPSGSRKNAAHTVKMEAVGLRKSKSSSTLLCPVSKDYRTKAVKDQQGSHKLDADKINKPTLKSEPVRVIPVKVSPEAAKLVDSPQELRNQSVDEDSLFENDGSIPSNDWFSPRPSLGGCMLEEQQAQKRMGSAQQNLMESFGSDPSKLDKNDDLKSLSLTGSVEHSVDIAGLRSAIMNERRKEEYAQHYSSGNLAQTNQERPFENASKLQSDNKSLKHFDVSVSQAGSEFSKRTRTSSQSVGRNSVHDSAYSAPNVHHVPDGAEYSAASNYLSKDKRISREGVVGTSDIRLAESRGFDAIKNYNPPGSIALSFGNAYAVSEVSQPSDSIHGNKSGDGRISQLGPPSGPYVQQGNMSHLQKHVHDRQPMAEVTDSCDNILRSGTRTDMPPPDKIPLRKPTLLTNQSLMQTDFAQRHLDKRYDSDKLRMSDISMMTNETTMHSFVELEPENNSTFNQVYGADVPSFMQQGPACHSTPYNIATMPVHFDVANHGKSATVSSSRSHDRPNISDSSLQSTMMTPRQSRAYIEAPSILAFPDPCCIGISSETTLPVRNPTPRWLQVVLFIKDLSLNGREVDPSGHCPFKLKNKFTIEPDSTENITVIFLPRSHGAYVSQLDIFCQPFVHDNTMIPDGFPTTVTLQAISERPMIQLVTQEEGGIDFGIMTWGKSKMAALSVKNVGKAKVPLRLAITASQSWHCFMFDSSSSQDLSVVSKSCRPVTSALGKSVVNLCLDGYNAGVCAEEIKVFCRPPEKQSLSVLASYPPDEIEARIDVEVDTPIPSLPPIASVQLRAVIGVLKLHTTRTMEVIHLKCQVGKRSEERLKLKNSGNITMEVNLSVSQFTEVFRVVPEKLLISPGNMATATVILEPQSDQDAKQYDTSFLMYLPLDNTSYELNLKGEVQAAPKRPFLLSDRSFLAFGGVAIGRAKQLKAIILNNAPQSLKITVDVSSDSHCFQLQSSVSKPDNTLRRRDMVIQPQEKLPVYVLYAPDRVAANAGKLAVWSHDTGMRFSIPLSGYGGVSSIKLEDVMQSGSDKYFTSLGSVSVGNNCVHRVTVSNVGKRAAFVRATAYEDLQCCKPLVAGRIAVDPNEFIILPGQKKNAVLAFSPSRREVAICREHKEIVATVAFYHGDEIGRQKYRRRAKEATAKDRKSIENTPLRDVNFDVRYVDEENVSVQREGLGMVDTASDIQLFYKSVSKTTLSLIGEPSTYNSQIMTTPPQQSSCKSVNKSLHPGLLSVGGQNTSTTSQQEPSRDYSISMSDDTKLSQMSVHTEDWEIQPEQLILSMPPRGEEIVIKSFQILNFARRSLNFYLCWPGHCVQVAPEQGVIPARSTKEFRVSPLPSLYDCPDLLPWSGNIQVNCDGQPQVLKVQIRSGIIRDIGSPSRTSGSLVPLAGHSNTQSISLPDTAAAERSKDVMLTQRQIEFNKTRIGEYCENTVEFTNTANDPIHWEISSFAPAYVKGVDHGSDVYRVSYAVFQFNTKSGNLQPRETAKVPVVFFPQSSGTFTQYWEVKCNIKSAVAGSSVTFKVHLVGQGEDVEKDVKPEKSSSASAAAGKHNKDRSKMSERPVKLLKQDVVHVDAVVGQKATVKVMLQNTSHQSHKLEIVAVQPPFTARHKTFAIGARKMLKYPLEFQSSTPGTYEGLIVFRTDIGYSLSIHVKGTATQG